MRKIDAPIIARVVPIPYSQPSYRAKSQDAVWPTMVSDSTNVTTQTGNSNSRAEASAKHTMSKFKCGYHSSFRAHIWKKKKHVTV